MAKRGVDFLIEKLREGCARGVVEDIAVAFGEFIGRLDGRDTPDVVLAACWVSHRTAQGDICVDLGAVAGKPVFVYDAVELVTPPLEEWIRVLRESPMIGTPGELRPLVLDPASRLYLYRYWDYERCLAQHVIARAAVTPEARALPILRSVLDEFYGEPHGATLDWQRIAVAVAALKRFCIIAGGPGTGKTTTVVRLLAVLARLDQGRHLRIMLTAPTGKAAARVAEAIRAAKTKLAEKVAGTLDIPDEAVTLHRLLGARAGTTEFRYHAGNPLPADVVIVDEASMVDLALMAKLVDALAPTTRLILVGDRDQLASVEAGAVLADLSGTGGSDSGFSPEFAAQLLEATGQKVPSVTRALSPLRNNVVVLEQSHRFGGQSGIGQLARCVRNGNVVELEDLFTSAREDIAWFRLKETEGRGARWTEMLARIVAGYTAYREAVYAGAGVAGVFAAFNRFRVLCAVHTGIAGVESLNQRIEEALWLRRISPMASWYAGRPVMVLRNDYSTGLFNGDIGIALPEEQDHRRLRVYFPAAPGYRGFHPARLPPHETVYAMTVHKSQGSEFDEVLLLLPDANSKALSRELFYTATTRARRRFELWASVASVAAAVSRRVTRVSGLAEQIYRLNTL